MLSSPLFPVLFIELPDPIWGYYACWYYIGGNCTPAGYIVAPYCQVVWICVNEGDYPPRYRSPPLLLSLWIIKGQCLKTLNYSYKFIWYDTRKILLTERFPSPILLHVWSSRGDLSTIFLHDYLHKFRDSHRPWVVLTFVGSFQGFYMCSPRVWISSASSQRVWFLYTLPFLSVKSVFGCGISCPLYCLLLRRNVLYLWQIWRGQTKRSQWLLYIHCKHQEGSCSWPLGVITWQTLTHIRVKMFPSPLPSSSEVIERDKFSPQNW